VVGGYVAPNILGLGRAGAGAFHPTNAAATASLALVLIVSSRVLFQWQWARWLLWPSVAVHSVALLVAHNRASLLITLPVIGGIVLLNAAAHWRWLLLTAGSLAAAAYIALDPGFSLVRHTGGEIAHYMARDQSVKQLTELSGRQEMWSAVWDSFLDSPWLGHGYFVSSETGSIKVWYVWANWTAHNFWLQVLVGTGIIGALLLTWALITYLLRLAGAYREGVGLRRLVALGCAVLAWQTGWGLTNESFVGPQQAESIVFFVVLGLVIGRMVRAESCALALETQNPLPTRQRRFIPAREIASFN
jgi:O-antigen ligase